MSGACWQGDDEESSSSAASSSQSGGAAAGQPGFFDANQVCLSVLSLVAIPASAICSAFAVFLLFALLPSALVHPAF